jgi:lactate dehydrogenase-like 2-hydroxyacid dehydrogenase
LPGGGCAVSANLDPLIVLTPGVQHALIARLRERFEVLGPLTPPLARSTATLRREQVANIRAIVTLGSTVISRQDMAALPQLGLIACTGAGYEGLDLVAEEPVSPASDSAYRWGYLDLPAILRTS